MGDIVEEKCDCGCHWSYQGPVRLGVDIGDCCGCYTIDPIAWFAMWCKDVTDEAAHRGITVHDLAQQWRLQHEYEPDEPVTYDPHREVTYRVDDEIYTGNMKRVVEALEHERITGEIVVAKAVWTTEIGDDWSVQLVAHPMHLSFGGYNEDDWAYERVRIPTLGFDGGFRVDGRA